MPLAAGVMSTANVQGNQILWAVKSGPILTVDSIFEMWLGGP